MIYPYSFYVTQHHLPGILELLRLCPLCLLRLMPDNDGTTVRKASKAALIGIDTLKRNPLTIHFN